MKNAADVLGELAQPSNAAVHSSPSLAGSVSLASAEDDKEREKKEHELLRRKTNLEALPTQELESSIRLTPWEVLHTLGRAMALARQGAGRGLAEHWGCLKYTQALTGSSGAFLTLSSEGRETAEYYKALQSRELGVGFALALTQRILRRRYPDHSVSIVAADTALRAGWALTSRDSGTSAGYRYRPQFFAEVWKPGEPSRALPLACKGNHSGPSASYAQLASASAHVEAVHIGAWNETPALVFSTELPLDGPLTIHALHARGNGGMLDGPADTSGRVLDDRTTDENIFPGIQPPTEGNETPPPVPGFHVRPEQYAWFQHVLDRAAAAGLTAFAGDGEATVQYLTKRQGQRHFAGWAHAATGSVQDARQTLLGIPFVGTDHVFRLNRTRVEAFSGVAEDLFRYLEGGMLERYRSEVHARRAAWPRDVWDSKWDGPVSVHEDGSVLAMRVLPT